MTIAESLFYGLLLFPFSFFSLLGHLISIYRVHGIRRDGVQTEGRVDELLFDDEETAAPRLLVKYTDGSGRVFEIRTAVGSATWGSLKGQAVAVLHKRTDPTAAFVDIERGPSWFFFVIHSVLVVVGAAFLINALRLLLR